MKNDRYGIIVRGHTQGVTDDFLLKDYQHVLNLWKDALKKAKQDGPMCIAYKGLLICDGKKLEVFNTTKTPDGIFIHHCKPTEDVKASIAVAIAYAFGIASYRHSVR